MNKFILAFAAVAALSSPALAEGSDTTSRVDASESVQNTNGPVATDRMMDNAAGLSIPQNESSSQRGVSVNDRPYDDQGAFRF